MKKWSVFLFLICIFSGAVLGSIEVHNVNVSDVSLPSEIIKGKINLTIVNEGYDAKIKSNDDDEIGLGEFLDSSGAIFECSTFDCSNGYVLLDDITDKNFDVPASGKKTIAFVLYGKDVNLAGLSFKIVSNFDESYRTPLKIEFFEEENWEFEDFSDTFLLQNWGCYDKIEGEKGAEIGEPLYCEMISIPDSGKLRVGAYVSGAASGTGVLTMNVYPEGGSGSPKTCDFDPKGGEEYCLIDEFFPADNYQVCVSTEGVERSGYYIYSEDVGENCGFVYPNDGSSRDYAIFAQAVRYADFNSLDVNGFNSGDFNEDLVDAADEIIADKYNRDCLGGCVLPLVFSGVSQNIKIYDVELIRTEEGQVAPSDGYVYDLDVSLATINFSGILDLEVLGFSVSRSMDYIVKVGSKKLFNKTMKILPVPEIFSVMPLNPPAGVSIPFYANVNFSGNDSLSYKWNFGDGEVVTTSEPNIFHSYTDLGNYILTLEVGSGLGLASKKNFTIESISPRVAIDVGLASRRKSLDKIISNFDNLTFWYKDVLLDTINIDFFDEELDKLNEVKENASSNQDFVDIAKYFYTLEVPSDVVINNFKDSYLMTKIEDVNVEAVAIAGKDVGEDNNDYYSQPILAWQNKNIDVSFSRQEFLISLWNGDSKRGFKAYSFNVSSKSDDESYFIINMPLNELSFREDVGAEEAGNATVIVLAGKADKLFEFYYNSEEVISFFVSPKLSSIILESAIDTTCNYNLVCEEQDGENSINCRTDCKPVTEAIIYIFFALIFVLIIYTILQVWYKHKYEKYLFKDDRQMYNLLMYVTNARAQGMKDSRIAVVLRGKGWISERVNYIIKKSRGKRTGLYEIIPIEKIAAFFRNRKARNVQAAKVVARGPLPAGARNRNNIVTGDRQQMGRNINKSRFQRRM